MSFHSIEELMVPAVNKLPVYDAETLTKGKDQAHIILGDQTYTLRITRAGKLLLTKWLAHKKNAGVPPLGTVRQNYLRSDERLYSVVGWQNTLNLATLKLALKSSDLQ
jgi:hemin uptake protein HemP